jgi:hypothetical protein
LRINNQVAGIREYLISRGFLRKSSNEEEEWWN